MAETWIFGDPLPAFIHPPPIPSHYVYGILEVSPEYWHTGKGPIRVRASYPNFPTVKLVFRSEAARHASLVAHNQEVSVGLNSPWYTNGRVTAGVAVSMKLLEQDR